MPAYARDRRRNRPQRSQRAVRRSSTRPTVGASREVITGLRLARCQPLTAIPQRQRGTGAGHPVDNLAVGFALSGFHVSLAVAALTIGGISVALSLIGLELGAQIGARAGQRGELVGGLVLIAVGAAIAAGLI
jgi:hypothetical protein